MPFFNTNKPMLSVLRSLGVQRPVGSDPQIGDDFIQALTSETPGHLAGVGARGSLQFNFVDPAAITVLKWWSTAPGGAILHHADFTTLSADSLVDVDFVRGAAPTATRSATHYGGRQNESYSAAQASSIPFGTMYLEEDTTTFLTGDGHGGSFFVYAAGAAQLQRVDLGIYIAPGSLCWLATTTTNSKLHGTMHYELLPYERSAEPF